MVQWVKLKKKVSLSHIDADFIPALLGHDLGLSCLHLFSRMPSASAPLGQIKHVPISSPATSVHLEVVRQRLSTNPPAAQDYESVAVFKLLKADIILL